MAGLTKIQIATETVRYYLKKLNSGERLPNCRDMAERCGVSYCTMYIAYNKLESEGLVEIGGRTLGTRKV